MNAPANINLESAQIALPTPGRANARQLAKLLADGVFHLKHEASRRDHHGEHSAHLHAFIARAEGALA